MSEASNDKITENSVAVIPADIRQRFEASDIFSVWEILDKVFHVNLKYWQKKFRIEYAGSLHSIERQEVFFFFLKKHLERPLNVLRGNHEQERIIEKIVRYVIRNKPMKRVEPQKINYSYPDYSTFYNRNLNG